MNTRDEDQDIELICTDIDASLDASTAVRLYGALYSMSNELAGKTFEECLAILKTRAASYVPGFKQHLLDKVLMRYCDE